MIFKDDWSRSESPSEIGPDWEVESGTWLIDETFTPPMLAAPEDGVISCLTEWSSKAFKITLLDVDASPAMQHDLYPAGVEAEAFARIRVEDNTDEETKETYPYRYIVEWYEESGLVKSWRINAASSTWSGDFCVCCWSEAADDDYQTVEISRNSDKFVIAKRTPFSTPHSFSIGGAGDRVVGAVTVEKQDNGEDEYRCGCCGKCCHCQFGDKPRCIKLTTSGFTEVSPPNPYQCETGCDCFNDTFYLKDSGRCTWESARMNQYIACAPASKWNLELSTQAGATEDDPDDYILILSLLDGSRTKVEWKAILGAERPDCRSFSVSAWEFVSEEGNPSCNYHAASLQLEAISDSEACPDQKDRCPLCGHCGNVDSPDLVARVSGINNGGDLNGSFSLEYMGVDYYAGGLFEDGWVGSACAWGFGGNAMYFSQDHPQLGLWIKIGDPENGKRKAAIRGNKTNAAGTFAWHGEVNDPIDCDSLSVSGDNVCKCPSTYPCGGTCTISNE